MMNVMVVYFLLYSRTLFVSLLCIPINQKQRLRINKRVREREAESSEEKDEIFNTLTRCKHTHAHPQPKRTTPPSLQQEKNENPSAESRRPLITCSLGMKPTQLHMSSIFKKKTRMDKRRVCLVFLPLPRIDILPPPCSLLVRLERLVAGDLKEEPKRRHKIIQIHKILFGLFISNPAYTNVVSSAFFPPFNSLSSVLLTKKHWTRCRRRRHRPRPSNGGGPPRGGWRSAGASRIFGPSCPDLVYTA